MLAATSLHSATKYTIACDSMLWHKSLAVAQSQVGVRELTGKNDGESIDSYNASVGNPKGSPYCMAGQYWAFVQICKSVCILRTGHVRTFWNWAKRTGQRVQYTPQHGDFLCWGYATNASGHVERIREIGRAGWVITVAYNTSSGSTGSQREGGGVYNRQRNLIHPLGRMLVLGLVGI